MSLTKSFILVIALLLVFLSGTSGTIIGNFLEGTWKIFAVIGLIVAFSVVRKSSWRYLLAATALLIYGIAFSYQAYMSEMNGKTIYYIDRGRSIESIPVTRERFPSQFYKAVNGQWALSTICIGISVSLFVCYHKMRSPNATQY